MQVLLSTKDMDDLVIIDTETTGWNPNYHRVIEVAAIKVRNGVITDEYSNLISTSVEVPRVITQITGITNTELNKFGKEPDVVFPEVREFIGDSTFVAHNVHFDYRFLDAEFARFGLPSLTNPKLCTVQLARRSGLPITDFKLTTIKEYFGLDLKSHRALNDCTVCYELIKHQLFPHLD